MLLEAAGLWALFSALFLQVLIIALPLEMKLAMRRPVDAGGDHGVETGAHQITQLCQRPKPATEKSVSEIINGTPKAEKEEEFLSTAFLKGTFLSLSPF